MSKIKAKRQQEIEVDKLLKEVDDGLAEFAELWGDGEFEENSKEEEELREQLQKLEKYRAEIRVWEDDNQLQDYHEKLQNSRSLIEAEMRRFKVSEKSVRAKDKEDYETGPRAAAIAWADHCTTKLQVEISRLEEDTSKKQKREREDQVYEYKQHKSILERIQEALEEESLEPDDIESIQEIVSEFIEDISRGYSSLGFDVYDEILSLIEQGGHEYTEEGSEQEFDEAEKEAEEAPPAPAAVVPVKEPSILQLQPKPVFEKLNLQPPSAVVEKPALEVKSQKLETEITSSAPMKLNIEPPEEKELSEKVLNIEPPGLMPIKEVEPTKTIQRPVLMTKSQVKSTQSAPILQKQTRTFKVLSVAPHAKEKPMQEQPIETETFRQEIYDEDEIFSFESAPGLISFRSDEDNSLIEQNAIFAEQLKSPFELFHCENVKESIELIREEQNFDNLPIAREYTNLEVQLSDYKLEKRLEAAKQVLKADPIGALALGISSDSGNNVNETGNQIGKIYDEIPNSSPAIHQSKQAEIERFDQMIAETAFFFKDGRAGEIAAESLKNKNWKLSTKAGKWVLFEGGKVLIYDENGVVEVENGLNGVFDVM